MSPCSSDHIIPRPARVWRMVSEGSRAVLRCALAEPSLLIARTARIVTAALLRAHGRAQRRVSADTPGVPAYSQICSRNYSGQPIVTAAVYRGFGSQLRLAANRLR